MQRNKEFEGRKRSLPHRKLWLWVRAVAPLLAPFVISLLFIICYCGPNIHRGVACIVDSRLKLASGPKTRTELGAEGTRIFYPYELGEQISRVVHRNCGERPRWWSLDFWVNPDAQNHVTVTNLPSFGTSDGIARLFKSPKDPDHVDLAIVQDGLIIDGDLAKLNQDEPDQIQALAHLYKSVFCVFARKDSGYMTLRDLRGRHARAYLGQVGSGTRYLTRRVLKHYGIECQDVRSEWSPDQVARAMSSDSPDGRELDLAFVLDKLDSGVVHAFVESDQFDLVSLEDTDDLFRSVDMLRTSTTTKAVTLGKGILSDEMEVPSRPVTSIQTQTILACSADLPEWDGYRVTQTLNQHFKELGLGSESAAQVPQADPGSGYDYPIHNGAARYYRMTASSEAFPYSVLVVAIGASVALIAYWNALAQKRRADRITRQIDDILLTYHDDHEHIDRQLAGVKVRTVLDYKEGRLNKEGYERVQEYIKMFNDVIEDQVDGLIGVGVAQD
jgi:TRAP transporter TAXI family solute receptor